MASEAQLQEQVAEYLVKQYPDVLFHSDFGSGARLTPGQAAKQKRQNGGRNKWPDMFIAEKSIRTYITAAPKTIGKHPNCQLPNAGELFYYGLFLELKKDGTRLRKKSGEYVNEHIAKQAETLKKLRERGYCAEFAVGFDEAKRIIDEYLGGQ